MMSNPRQEFQTRWIDQFSAELYKKACERVVKEIVHKRERIAKNLKDEAKTNEELSKRQLETVA